MSDRTGLKSPRFQRFCDVRLGLSKGEVEIDEAVKRHVGTGDALRNWTDARFKSAELNFVEKLYQANHDALNIGKDSPDAERIEYLFYSIKGSK